jgi:hypothetical protein
LDYLLRWPNVYEIFGHRFGPKFHVPHAKSRVIILYSDRNYSTLAIKLETLAFINVILP